MTGILPHRIPGHPRFHYYPVSGGLWLYGPTGFIGVFTHRDLARYFEQVDL